MSDLFYNFVWHSFNPVFWMSSSPVVIGREHTRRDGAFILASTHLSHYDVPLMIRHSVRKLDFVSIVEVFKNPAVAWFYGSMNAFPLDRSRKDPATIRKILIRLERGRAIAMFPEGRIARGENSVLRTGRIRPGIGRIALLAKAPIVPCVVVNSQAYSQVRRWLPIKQTHYGVIFGPVIEPAEEPQQTEERLIAEYIRLHAILKKEMDQRWPGGV